MRIDNLKAAVKKDDWYDPELNPKIVAFAEHYGSAVIPTRPYTPQHKGKVESPFVFGGSVQVLHISHQLGKGRTAGGRQPGSLRPQFGHGRHTKGEKGCCKGGPGQKSILAELPEEKLEIVIGDIVPKESHRTRMESCR